MERHHAGDGAGEVGGERIAISGGRPFRGADVASIEHSRYRIVHRQRAGSVQIGRWYQTQAAATGERQFTAAFRNIDDIELGIDMQQVRNDQLGSVYGNSGAEHFSPKPDRTGNIGILVRQHNRRNSFDRDFLRKCVQKGRENTLPTRIDEDDLIAGADDILSRRAHPWRPPGVAAERKPNAVAFLGNDVTVHSVPPCCW